MLKACNAGLWHVYCIEEESMIPAADIPAFFEEHVALLSLYETLEEKIFRAFPDTEKKKQKTQITFTNRYVFACVSFLRFRKRKERPDDYFTLTLGLPCPLHSPRAVVCTEPYPGRWTVHIPVYCEDDIDEELMNLIREAYLFSLQKRKKKA